MTILALTSLLPVNELARAPKPLLPVNELPRAPMPFLDEDKLFDL